MIDWPGRYEVDNTVINYERRGRAEIVTIEGPTTRKLILKVSMVNMVKEGDIKGKNDKHCYRR